MPSEETEPGSPENWLMRAKSNLILAKTPIQQGLYWEDLCFNLQQAVEKCLKAVLLYKEIQFPYTHQISRLIDLIKRSEILWNAKLEAADELSDYAVQARYLGNFEPVTEEEYREAVEIIEEVLAWAESIVVEEAQQ